MVAITLPDGSVRRFDRPITGADLAADIGPGLAKAALAVLHRRGDMKKTWRRPSTRTPRSPSLHQGEDPDALELLRHDAAHVMAEAVQELFPGTQVTIGPAIENGFYYDFARDTAFTLGRPGEDREGAHARDRRPRRAHHPRGVGPRTKPSLISRSIGEKYKAEIIEGLPEAEPDIGVYSAQQER